MISAKSKGRTWSSGPAPYCTQASSSRRSFTSFCTLSGGHSACFPPPVRQSVSQPASRLIGRSVSQCLIITIITSTLISPPMILEKRREQVRIQRLGGGGDNGLANQQCSARFALNSPSDVYRDGVSGIFATGTQVRPSKALPPIQSGGGSNHSRRNCVDDDDDIRSECQSRGHSIAATAAAVCGSTQCVPALCHFAYVPPLRSNPLAP